MSEYQFYEFRAIDKPLSKEDKIQIGSWSSRSNPSNTGVVFSYNYGDFPRDEITVMEKYFDAMFYISNLGTTRLIFKFPKALLKLNEIKQYCSEDGLKIIEKPDFILLDISFSEEDSGRWMDGEDWLVSLISLRDDILNEDYRCLYLNWLQNNSPSADGHWGSLNQGKLEPHVPNLLNELNGALQEFVTVFGIEKDYITVATENSKLQYQERPIDLAPNLDKLSEKEKTEFLLRLLDEEPFLNIKLKTRLKEFTDTNETSIKEEPRRTIGEIIQKVNKIKQERKNKAKIEREEKQLKKLIKLEGQEIEVWAKVPQLISEKNTKAYDQVILLLKDLKELSIYKNRFKDFCEKIELIKINNSRLSGLTSRLNDAKLESTPKSLILPQKHNDSKLH